MPDSTRRVLTNFAVAGNVDSLRDGLGDRVDSYAFMRTMYELEADHAKQAEAVARRTGDLLDEYRLEKHQLLGEHRLVQRRDLLLRRRQELRELAAFSETDFRQIAEFRRETRRQAEAIIPRASLRNLQSRREAVAGELERLALGPERPIEVEVLDDKDVPEAIRSSRHNPPFAVVPPYPWSWTTFNHECTGGSSELTNSYLDATLGKVGHRMTYQNDSASDNDSCNARGHSLVGFMVPPQGATKKWRFWITVVCGAARGRFRWTDEAGASYTDNIMGSQLEVNIDDPSGSGFWFEIWRQRWHGDDDWDHSYEFAPHGWSKTYVATTSSELPNKSQLVTIGTRNGTIYFTDDVGLDNVMNDRWQIKKVVIELVS